MLSSLMCVRCGFLLALPLGSTTRAHHFFCLAEFRDPLSRRCDHFSHQQRRRGPWHGRTSWRAPGGAARRGRERSLGDSESSLRASCSDVLLTHFGQGNPPIPPDNPPAIDCTIYRCGRALRCRKCRMRQSRDDSTRRIAPKNSAAPVPYGTVLKQADGACERASEVLSDLCHVSVF